MKNIKIILLFAFGDLFFLLILALYLYFYFYYGILYIELPWWIIFYSVIKVIFFISIKKYNILNDLIKYQYFITGIQICILFFIPNFLEMIPSPNSYYEEPIPNLISIIYFEREYKGKYGNFYYGDITTHLYEKGMHTILFDKEKFEKLKVPLVLQSKLNNSPVGKYMIPFYKFFLFNDEIKIYPVQYHYIVKKINDSYIINADVIYAGNGYSFTLNAAQGNEIIAKYK